MRDDEVRDDEGADESLARARAGRPVSMKRMNRVVAAFGALVIATCRAPAPEPMTELVPSAPGESVGAGVEEPSKQTEPVATGMEEPSRTATPPALSKSTDSPPTATPTPTWTATPGADETVTVRFSLHDAEREVLSWFDSRREARIEWSGYVRRMEVAKAF